MEDDITLAFNKIRVNVQQRWVHCTVYNAYTAQCAMNTLHFLPYITMCKLKTVQYTMHTLCNDCAQVHCTLYAVSSVQYPQDVSLQFFETVLIRFSTDLIILKLRIQTFYLTKKIIWKYLFSDICTQSNTKISKNRRWGVTVR